MEMRCRKTTKQKHHPAGDPPMNFLTFGAQLTKAAGTNQDNPLQDSSGKNSTPIRCVFPEKNSKAALFHVFNMHQKSSSQNRATNRRRPENTERNRPDAPKVLNNSPTTIPAQSRKIRYFAPPHCANIQPENEQKLMQDYSRERPRRRSVSAIHPGTSTRPNYFLLRKVFVAFRSAKGDNPANLYFPQRKQISVD
jgi:hypothetical protein